MSAAIEINDVCKRYGKLTALDHVSLQIAKGEMFGLIGPDGAGKSSLYRILATLTNPDAGNASILGFDTAKDYKEIRRRIGYMPERFSLYPDMTVMENLNFFASLFGVNIKDNYDLIAPFFGQLERFPNRLAGKLSGGMKQKLALSCALIHHPDVLLLDEPTTGVDAVSRSEFWEMLRTLKEKEITIMVSTSYMDEATLCERIAIIDRGHILSGGTPDALVAHLGENLFNAMATDMFGLLSALRKMPQVANCYTFGATLHVVGTKDFDSNEIERKLKAEGIADARIYPAKGNIEDLFIKLAGNEDQ